MSHLAGFPWFKTSNMRGYAFLKVLSQLLDRLYLWCALKKGRTDHRPSDFDFSPFTRGEYLDSPQLFYPKPGEVPEIRFMETKWLPLSIFWGLWFFNFSARIIPSPVLSLIENELMLSHAKAGGLFTFLYAGYAFSLLMAGSLAPRVGYKRSIIWGQSPTELISKRASCS
jgi:hypothetical protein